MDTNVFWRKLTEWASWTEDLNVGLTSYTNR